MSRTPFLHPILFLIFTILISGCGSNHETMARMDRADSIMETAPDSALCILDSINPGTLASKKDKARYALLKSMAYDKNYIDTTSFDVIQPAIDYYLSKGNHNEKLRTLFYQGRIYQNRNEDEEAMKCFIKAIELKDEITDSIVLARIYTAKAYLYYNQNQFISSSTNSISAAEICEKIGRMDLEADNLTQAFDAFINVQDRYHADSIFRILESIPEHYKQTNLDKHCKIIYATNFLFQKELLKVLDSINRDNLNNNLLLDMALGYAKAGDKMNSMNCLQAVNEASYTDKVKYLFIKSKVEEVNEEYEKALFTLREGIEASDSTINEWTKDDRMFVVNKYELEKKLLKEKERKKKYFLSSVIIILTLISLLLVLFLRFREAKIKGLKNDKEKIQYKMNVLLLDKKYIEIQESLKHLNNDFKQIQNENTEVKTLNKIIKEENNQILNNMAEVRQTLLKIEKEKKRLAEMAEEKKRIAKELKKNLIDKISLINGLVASHISSDDKHRTIFLELINTVDNEKERFLSSIRDNFEALYPKFMNKLKERKFSEIEIDYVCLYAIGLRGKEIGNYLQTKSHYNISSDIRAKLGLDKNETNLGKFIINEIRKEE